MAIDVSRSFEIDGEGLSIVDDDGNLRLYLTAGAGSPVGTASPVSTIYVDENNDIWRKVGAGDNDWTKLIWDRNFSKFKLENENLTIPDNEEMIVTGFCIDENSCINVSDSSSLTVIRGGN